MKTKYLIAAIAALMVLCAVLSAVFFLSSSPCAYAEIKSNGTVICTVALDQDNEFTVTLPDGSYNTIVCRNGKISVTDATCPDHHCMLRGWCDSGAPIVCLPNKLVITFQSAQGVDGAVG